MLVFFAIMAGIAALGTYLTERVDRPRRRAMRLAAEAPAE